MHTVFCQCWLESEGGDRRPDGYSLHLNLEDIKHFIANYTRGRTGPTPAAYDIPHGTPYQVAVSDDVYRQIEGFGKMYGGKWPTEHEAPPARYKMGINPVTIKPSMKLSKYALTLGRMHMGFGEGPLSKLVQLAVYDPVETEKAVAEKKTPMPPVALAIIDEDIFMEALGYVFNHGELAGIHLQKHTRPADISHGRLPRQPGDIVAKTTTVAATLWFEVVMPDGTREPWQPTEAQKRNVIHKLRDLGDVDDKVSVILVSANDPFTLSAKIAGIADIVAAIGKEKDPAA